MTQAARGPITKINQSKCSIAGPIFSKYWTGYCPEWSRTCVFPVFALYSCVINLLLTKLAQDPYWENIGPRSFLYWPHSARSVLSRPRANILPVPPSRLVHKIYVHVTNEGARCRRSQGLHMSLGLYAWCMNKKPATLILGYLGENEPRFLNKLIGRLQIQVQALAKDIVLCPWTRHFILTTVPLSSQVYKCLQQI